MFANRLRCLRRPRRKGVVTFYTLFNQTAGRQAPGLRVCRTPAMRAPRRLRRHRPLREAPSASTAEETTADGNVTLRSAECLASCGTAPMMQGRQGLPRESSTRERVDRDPRRAPRKLSSGGAKRPCSSGPTTSRACTAKPDALDARRLRARAQRLPSQARRVADDDDDPRADGASTKPRRRTSSGAVARASRWASSDGASCPRGPGRHRKHAAVVAHYLVVNADEGEPGTHKDRTLMEERNPHACIEGCIIACYGIGAHVAYIYVRDEELHLSKARPRGRHSPRRSARGYLGRDALREGDLPRRGLRALRRRGVHLRRGDLVDAQLARGPPRRASA